MIGEKMGLPSRSLQQLYYAGLLHDIGKISVDGRLLAKKGKLTDAEFEKIKQHSIHGSRIIATLPGMSQLALWIRWHHEWWNGAGYPDKLQGEDIPLEVRILGVIDCFDSLQTPRLDRDRYSQEEAYHIVEQQRGTHFNPDILDVILEMVKEKTLIPGQSSDRFLQLKAKYIDIPFQEFSGGYWEGTGIAELYPILRLFARVIDAKHKYTRGHSTRVSILARHIARRMELPPEEVVKVEVAGLLHDAGKISVPVEILDKPGAPSEEEWEIIRGHPKKSLDILSTISALKDIAEISAAHHEKYDGSGYPNHINGAHIHKLSQIIAIADTYDAITSNRSYRKGRPPEVAYKIVRNEMGRQFNPQIAKVLLEIPSKHIEALFSTYEVDDVE